NDEQRKQVQYIRRSSEELLQLVNDVLDLTRVEAGRTPLRADHFTASELIASLRGMLRPLLRADSPVRLIWDEPDPALELETDRAKLAQILRNLVANALKFTERGEIRVQTAVHGPFVRFTVRDTGIGIPEHALAGIFEEFTQVASHLQARVQGSGLGLPLARQLAEALGGEIDVESEPGRGSTFTVDVPRVLSEAAEVKTLEVKRATTPVGPASILVVEDDRKTMLMYEKYLAVAGFHVVPARSIDAARAVLTTTRPVAIVLDIMLENETSWNFLGELKRDPATADIPVLVCTVTDRELKARALGADEFWLKPIDPDRLRRKLQTLTRPAQTTRVLVIDDDERARYLMTKHLGETPYELHTAATGAEGVALARTCQPQLIFLDFLLREMTAFDVLDQLKADPRTRKIPVVVVTSHVLEESDRRRLLTEAEAVLSKEHLSREVAIHRIRDALGKAGVAGTVSS
ncbi:MAG TPA: ATP-binding protein, partial [Nannocystis sp.]